MTDTQTLLTYLRSNLTDPASRGYPTSNGLHWIFISNPSISFSSIGYPIVYIDLPDTGEISRRHGSGVVDRSRLTIMVFASKMSHIDTLKTQLRGLFKSYSQSSLPGFLKVTVDSTQVTSNIIDNSNVYQMLFSISFITMES